ncbi:MAG TPA: carboxypeptidase-like regulatory domain-containing protein, partial [Candidatus Thermoplasmatota archaeon]|nr:carboxypeptidase-like regulatory domain-containing protein [Candidatus Thermoplasmatota archaeon]
MRKPEALLAILVVTAGCFGAATTNDDNGGPSDALVEPRPGVQFAADRGAILGRVLDDAGLPLRAARVSLLGTEEFRDTDAAGDFRFLNVSAGEARVQAFSPGFVANDTLAIVSAGNITDVVLYLLPDSGRGAGYTPHRHDFWAGQDMYVLMNGDQDFRRDGRPEGRYSNVNDTPSS